MMHKWIWGGLALVAALLVIGRYRANRRQKLPK